MRKIYYLLVVLVAGLSACTTLDENPASFISPDQFYKTAGDAVAAVNAAYYPITGNGDGNQPIYNSLFNTGMAFMTDDENAGPGSPNADARAFGTLTQATTNLRIKEIWQQHYAGINKANVALDRIPGISFDQKLKNRLLGEARFLRALYYFDLVRTYGDVPLLLTDQTQVPVADLQVARTPKDQVYTQIVADLDSAINYFHNGSTPEVGRATEGASKSLLSKVYLTQRDWANSLKLAEEVINGTYGYGLFDTYSQVFLPANKNGKEHIFSAQFKGTVSNAVTARDIMTGIPGLKGSYGDQLTFYTVGSDKFYSIFKLYSAKDKRKRVSFTTSYTSPTDGKKYVTLNVPGDSVPFFNKYWDPNYAKTSLSEANAPILRFAEILLIHAESENELNGPTTKAYTSINKIRTRAGLPNLTTGLTQDQFRDSVYLERRLELVGEYQRYFDLIRETGTEVTGVGPLGKGILLKALNLVGKTNVAAKHYLYPIPQTEIDRNPKLTQNTGWDK